MPRGDGTGPAGMGPMTGRGAGYCAGYGLPAWGGYVPPTVATPTSEQQIDALKAQAEHLSRTLNAVSQRISELEKKEADE